MLNNLNYIYENLDDDYNSTQIAPLRFGEGEITETDQYKFLGINLDSRLTFKHHVNHIKSKISKSVGVIYKLNKFVPQNILLILYGTLIKPYLTYGIEAWFSAPDYILNKIRVLQKKSIRAICNLSFNAHTRNHFKNLKLLTVDDIFKENISIFVYKSLKMDQNIAISGSFICHSDIHVYDTRNRDQLVLPRSRKSRTQKGFLIRGIKIWNELSIELKSLRTLKLFKMNIKNHLLENY